MKTLATLTIRVQNYSVVATKPELMKKLRKLTIDSYSGMNRELNNFEKIIHTRKVDCQILLAYRSRVLAGWALLSREPSNFNFPNTGRGFDPIDGVLFEVFIDTSYRKQGIGTELLKVARRKANGKRLCICPWDGPSDAFFYKFRKINAKEL
jgi:GNAT superfamily N-acetyltransferase